MTAVRITIEIAPNAQELDEVTRPDLFTKLGAVYDLGSGGSRSIKVGAIGRAVESALAQNIPWYDGRHDARVPQPVESGIRTTLTEAEYKALQDCRKEALGELG